MCGFRSFWEESKNLSPNLSYSGVQMILMLSTKQR